MSECIKILLTDDHALIRQATRQIVEQVATNIDVLEAASAREALQLLQTHADCRLMLLDLGLPDSRGLDTFYEIRRRHPQVSVAILSANEVPDLARAAHTAGAVGFIPKSSSAQVLESALRIIIAGGQYIPPALMQSSGGLRHEELTERQKDVLRCLQQGKTNKEIARILNLGETTVKTHLASIFRVLRVKNRMEAIVALKDQQN